MSEEASTVDTLLRSVGGVAECIGDNLWNVIFSPTDPNQESRIDFRATGIEISKHADIGSVSINNEAFGDDALLSLFPAIAPNCIELSVFSSAITPRGLQVLRQLPNLERIYLRGIAHNEWMTELSHCRNLRDVSLTACKISANCDKVFAGKKSLVSLFIEDCDGPQLSLDLSDDAQLSSLFLWNDLVTDSTCEGIRLTSPHLSEMLCMAPRITHIGFQSLLRISALENLTLFNAKLTNQWFSPSHSVRRDNLVVGLEEADCAVLSRFDVSASSNVTFVFWRAQNVTDSFVLSVCHQAAASLQRYWSVRFRDTKLSKIATDCLLENLGKDSISE